MKGFLSILVAIVSTLSYINAGTVLYRHNIPPSAVASPTKYPEYAVKESPKDENGLIILYFVGKGPTEDFALKTRLYRYFTIGQFQYDSLKHNFTRYGAFYIPNYHLNKLGHWVHNSQVSKTGVSLISTTSSPKTYEAVGNLNNDQDETTINNDSTVAPENEGMYAESDVSSNNNDAIADDGISSDDVIDDGDDGSTNSNSGSDSNDDIPADGSGSNTESYNDDDIPADGSGSGSNTESYNVADIPDDGSGSGSGSNTESYNNAANDNESTEVSRPRPRPLCS